MSVGSFGCNFSCGFCQNYSISQNKPQSQYVSPESLAALCSNQDNNVGIAFTYNEPSIWYEYVYDSAKKLKEKDPNQNVILVTDGFIESEPLD